ncbi:beta-lactamase/transpeptidase-like protein [Exidia glandulosa HHB12029]|uniref:Beta-lactamase/transpeptidase-like protein n=1 Tax=Exidia glandulosa HHB12029 TaxID=1314781 RepID=A0A165G0P7_EXIGL|nr:beta-lactamase/transpeptidase-like protein [Exidia glandulosa HHB12029]
MASSLSQQVRTILSDAVNAPNGVPGLVFGAVNAKGETIVAEAAGVTTLDSYFALFSITKLITGLAAMQLVQHGKLTLDEPIAKVLPEIARVKVLAKDGVTLSDPETKITLRMLLTHTSGFGYSFFDEALSRYTKARPDGKDEFSGTREGVLDMPLVREPGTAWTYGVGMDWVGEAIMRVSGQTLEQYCGANIFSPLGITEVKWRVTPENKGRLVDMYSRLADGSVVKRELFTHELPEPEDAPRFQCGGMGAFASLASLLCLFSAILSCDPALGLSAETLDEMFTDQFDGKRVKLGADALNITGTFSGRPDLAPPLANDPSLGRIGFGLTWMILHDGLPTGRSPDSVMWDGLPNCYWGMDRAKGIATVMLAQLLPSGDPTVIGAYFEAEGAVYASLASA